MSTGKGQRGAVAAALIGVLGVGAWDAWTLGSRHYRLVVGDAWVNPKSMFELGAQVFLAASAAIAALWCLLRLKKDAGNAPIVLLAYFCLGTLALKALGWALYR